MMGTPPQRIVSLVPSLTELIIDLNGKSRLVGRTRFCVLPKNAVEDIEIVGGTKNPRIDKIRKLNPDLIIANKEENRKEDLDQLATDYSVFVTDIATIEDALITIHEIGEKIGAKDEADRLANDILALYNQRPNEKPLQTAYLIWRSPWMSVGNDTYIHDVLQQWNLTNVFGYTTRYPRFELNQLQDLQPELILLSSEPFPFKNKHIEEIRPYCPDARILTINGQWFSWYGSRMKHSFKKLNTFRKAIS